MNLDSGLYALLLYLGRDGPIRIGAKGIFNFTFKDIVESR